MLRRHADGFDPHDLAAAGVRPVRRAGRPGRRRGPRYAPVTLAAGGDRLRRGPRAGRPGARRRCARRVASRRDRRCCGGAGLGLAVRPRLRHPRRRQGARRPALRHRVQLRAEAELEGVTADGVLDGVLATVPVPR